MEPRSLGTGFHRCTFGPLIRYGYFSVYSTNQTSGCLVAISHGVMSHHQRWSITFALLLPYFAIIKLLILPLIKTKFGRNKASGLIPISGFTTAPRPSHFITRGKDPCGGVKRLAHRSKATYHRQG